MWVSVLSTYRYVYHMCAGTHRGLRIDSLGFVELELPIVVSRYVIARIIT